MMKKNIKYGILVMMLLIGIQLAMATITFNTPSVTGETINGTYTFNITSAINNARCNFSTSDDGLFAYTVATGTGVLEYTNVSDTSALTDAEDTTLTVACGNTTAGSDESGTLVINIDNTAPVCAYDYSGGEETLTYLDLIGLSIIQSSTDTTDLTYSWSLVNPSGTETTSTSAEPTEYSNDISIWDELGDYTLHLNITDEAGAATTCSDVIFSVKGKDDDSVITTQTLSSTTLGTQNIMLILFGVAALVILVGGFFVVTMSKK